MYAVFNLNKQFISYAEQELGDNFLHIKLPEDKTNLLKWAWKGDYDTGEMTELNLSNMSMVKNQNTFEQKYPFNNFMSIILKQLYISSKKNNTLDTAYENMVKDYIFSFETPEIYRELLKVCNKI